MSYNRGFIFEINDIVNETIKILKPVKIPAKHSYSKAYEYQCLICNNIDIINEHKIKQGRKCSVCAGKKILVGYNDINTTHPQVSRLFKNEEDKYKYSHGSHKKIEFTCNECGRNSHKVIKDVVQQGFSCEYCSDGISIPEKFFHNILDSLNIAFISQKKFKWGGNKRYDIYFNNIICEIHGLQHYEKGFGKGDEKLLQIQENDIEKMELAINNNIDYIVIDARYSDLDWIKTSILNSRLNGILNLSDVDWELCFQNSLKSVVIKTCELWNSGLFTHEIAKKLHINSCTVQSYLKKGNSIGLCEYDKKNNNKISGQRKYARGISGIEKTWELNKKKVYCITLDEYFPSIGEAKNKYPNAYHIGLVCDGKRESSGKYNNEKLTWRYYDDKEYESYNARTSS